MVWSITDTDKLFEHIEVTFFKSELSKVRMSRDRLFFVNFL